MWGNYISEPGGIAKAALHTGRSAQSITRGLPASAHRNRGRTLRASRMNLGEKAAEYRGSVNVEPCWTFRIVPRRLTTWQGFGWHPRYKHPELQATIDGGDSNT